MDSNGRSLKVLLFPWLAHGHIFPFLELAKRLVVRNFMVYLCSTPVNLPSIKEEIEKSFSQIKLIELQLPNLPNLPPHYHTTRDLPTHLMPTLKEAFDLAKPAFIDILTTYKPDCLIYDFIQPWAPAAASDQNIPAIMFLTPGAASISYVCHLSKPPENKSRFPFPTILPLSREFLQRLGTKSSGMTDLERFAQCTERSSCVIALKSFREIEGKFMDYISFLTGKQIVPVGPLVRQVHEDNHEKPCKIVEWLDKKQNNSVVFVSFGTEYFMPKEEIEEIAEGLDLSEQNFIWVVRFPKDEKDGKEHEIEEALPSGFMKRVGERGMVVTGWAEQQKILCHPSTGGFLTHCGWSSVMEGLMLGVPLIALPMQLDQPFNERLLVSELGVAVEIERESGGIKRFCREKVAKGIRVAMVEKKGERVRRSAKEMSKRLSYRGEDEIDVFVQKMIGVCEESIKREKV